jgi:hypothetical protein
MARPSQPRASASAASRRARSGPGGSPPSAYVQRPTSSAAVEEQEGGIGARAGGARGLGERVRLPVVEPERELGARHVPERVLAAGELVALGVVAVAVAVAVASLTVTARRRPSPSPAGERRVQRC